MFQSDCLWLPQADARAYVVADICDRLTHSDLLSFCREFALTHRAKTLIPPHPILSTFNKMVHFVEGCIGGKL
jgi:hypothetical protein